MHSRAGEPQKPLDGCGLGRLKCCILYDPRLLSYKICNIIPAIQVRHRNGCWPAFWHLWRNSPLEIEVNWLMHESGPMPRNWMVEGRSFGT